MSVPRRLVIRRHGLYLATPDADETGLATWSPDPGLAAILGRRDAERERTHHPGAEAVPRVKVRLVRRRVVPS